jgi:hypothetical protein
MSQTTQRATTVPPELPPVASDPGLQLPSVAVPQLPPSVARHPLIAAAVIIALSVVSTIGGVYAVQPKGDKPEIKAMASKLETMSDKLGDIEQKLQRNEDRLGARIDRLEESQRDVKTYHENRSRTDTDWFRWQERTDRRLDDLEKRR